MRHPISCCGMAKRAGSLYSMTVAMHAALRSKLLGGVHGTASVRTILSVFRAAGR